MLSHQHTSVGVYRLVSDQLRGSWQNSDNDYTFWLKDKADPKPLDTVDLFLSIDREEKGIIELKFNEIGECHIYLNGDKSYKVHAMYLDEEGNQSLTLIEPKGIHIYLKRKEV